jgi:hypothetical protein
MQPNPLFAGLGPFAGLAQTGSQLATRGIQGLFGIKDPEIEAQRAIAMAAQNPNDPATLQAAAQALAQANKIDQAMALAGQARTIIEKERSFGLEQKRLDITRSQAEQQAKQGDERLRLTGEDLQLKRDKLAQDKTLTDVQVKKANAELNNLEKDYTPSLYKDNAGNALFNKKGEVGLFYFDDETNTIKRHKSSQGLTTIKPTAANPYDFLRGAMAGQQPIAAAGQPQGQAGGSLADMQARAAQALKDRMNK